MNVLGLPYHVEFILNGLRATAYAGQSIFEAVSPYLNLPCLCGDSVLKPGQRCGLCLVEVSGMPGLVHACQTPLKAGMEIVTFSGEVRRARLINLKQIAQNHVGDCLTCQSSGNCRLQKICQELHLASAFLPKNPIDLRLISILGTSTSKIPPCRAQLHLVK
jgi:predicted molibdopterin-dependent oxidoreductase YjgC